MCCEERSSCDNQRAPSAKKVCDSHTHTDTIEHNTHSHSDSNTPRTQRSVARAVCGLNDCPRRAQQCLKFQALASVTQRDFGPVSCGRPASTGVVRYDSTSLVIGAPSSLPPFPSTPFLPSTPQATRSTARRVSQGCLTRVVCSRFSKQGSAAIQRGFAFSSRVRSCARCLSWPPAPLRYAVVLPG